MIIGIWLLFDFSIESQSDKKTTERRGIMTDESQSERDDSLIASWSSERCLTIINELFGRRGVVNMDAVGEQVRYRGCIHKAPNNEDLWLLTVNGDVLEDGPLPIGSTHHDTVLREELEVSFVLDHDGRGESTFAADVMAVIPDELHFSNDWWQEVGEIKDLPTELQGLLRELISDLLHDCIPPRAEGWMIQQVKKYLQGVLIFLDDRHCYTIMVYVPKDHERNHCVFMLTPALPDGDLRRLDEYDYVTS
ncbi:MAG: hypothetical protein WC517_02895 [Patescibacteria group bacterium]